MVSLCDEEVKGFLSLVGCTNASMVFCNFFAFWCEGDGARTESCVSSGTMRAVDMSVAFQLFETIGNQLVGEIG